MPRWVGSLAYGVLGFILAFMLVSGLSELWALIGKLGLYGYAINAEKEWLFWVFDSIPLVLLTAVAVWLIRKRKTRALGIGGILGLAAIAVASVVMAVMPF